MMDVVSKFAAVIDPILAEKRWTHSDLAKSIGVSQSCMSRYFSGLRKPSSEQVATIARALGEPVSKLARDLDVSVPIEPSTYAALEALRQKAEARAELSEAALAQAKRERVQLEEVVRALHTQLAAVEADRDILSAKLRARDS